jgi:hypothetical protein
MVQLVETLYGTIVYGHKITGALLGRCGKNIQYVQSLQFESKTSRKCSIKIVCANNEQMKSLMHNLGMTSGRHICNFFRTDRDRIGRFAKNWIGSIASLKELDRSRRLTKNWIGSESDPTVPTHGYDNWIFFYEWIKTILFWTTQNNILWIGFSTCIGVMWRFIWNF